MVCSLRRLIDCYAAAQTRPRAAALHGAGRKLLPPGVDPVRDLIAERLQEDDDEARP